MKYTVIMNEIEYEVDVEKKDQIFSCNNEQEHSAELILTLIKSEYDHCVSRSEKLDNKIYILLTICAFVFAFFTSNLNP